MRAGTSQIAEAPLIALPEPFASWFRSRGWRPHPHQFPLSTYLAQRVRRDVLRQHEPGHILLKAAFADAATGPIDVFRLGGFLRRIKGRIRHIGLPQVSPLAEPVMLEIGRESVPGEASEILLRETVEELVAEALSGHAARKT